MKNNRVQFLKEKLGKELNISVSSIELNNNFFHSIVFNSKELGNLEVRDLNVQYLPLLFKFYYDGLTENSRKQYHPYPLFNTPPATVDELVSRFNEWKKEDNWIVLNICKDDIILATSDLKRIGTEDVTSGIAVRDDYQGKGLGYLLRMIVVEQARLLNIPRFHVKIVPANIASIKLHEKCGFVNTGELQYTHFIDGKTVTETVRKMEFIF